jgi:hypothetical protein
MALPSEAEATNGILADARFHRAAVKAGADTRHLAERVENAETTLKARRNETESKEEVRLEKLAVLLRSDFELDERCRLVELDVLKAAGKDRKATLYRAAFKNGFSSLIASRGDEQAREVESLATVLREQAAAIAAEHETELLRLAGATRTAEGEWKQAEVDAATAFGQERIARAELIRQLQKNEGALAELFPGKRRKVRSYFRPTRRRGASVPTGGPETPNVG